LVATCQGIYIFKIYRRHWGAADCVKQKRTKRGRGSTRRSTCTCTRMDGAMIVHACRNQLSACMHHHGKKATRPRGSPPPLEAAVGHSTSRRRRGAGSGDCWWGQAAGRIDGQVHCSAFFLGACCVVGLIYRRDRDRSPSPRRRRAGAVADPLGNGMARRTYEKVGGTGTLVCHSS
jgi:hypothetical protein